MKDRYEREVEAYDYVMYELDGDGYGSGQIEGLDTTVYNCRRFLARLTHVLLAKGLLNEEEVTKITDEYKWEGDK